MAVELGALFPSPHSSPAQHRWQAVFASTCHPAEHNWVCNFWSCRGKTSPSLRLIRSRKHKDFYCRCFLFFCLAPCTQSFTRQRLPESTDAAKRPAWTDSNLFRHARLLFLFAKIRNEHHDLAHHTSIAMPALASGTKQKKRDWSERYFVVARRNATSIYFLIPERWEAAQALGLHKETFWSVKKSTTPDVKWCDRRPTCLLSQGSW